METFDDKGEFVVAAISVDRASDSCCHQCFHTQKLLMDTVSKVALESQYKILQDMKGFSHNPVLLHLPYMFF